MEAEKCKDIGLRLKALRNSFGMTQAAFAGRCGVNRGYLAILEVGKKKPSSNLVEQLIEATNVNSNWLLTGEGSMFLPKTEEEVPTPNIEPLDKGAAELLEIFKNLDEESRQEMLRFAKKEQLFAELMKERAG